MENINFELYKIFIVVAKHKNLTKASNELYISQPAVTQSIQKLESQLGYKLFYRVKNGMNLTENGEVLYNHLYTSVEKLNSGKEVIDELNNTKTIIRIGSGITLTRNSLIKPIKKFKEIYPNIVVEIHSGITDNLISKLEEGLLDLVIMNTPHKENEKLKFEVIDHVEDSFVASSKEFSKYKNKIYSFKDLNDLPLVLQMSISTSRKYLDYLCAENHIVLKPEYELASYSLVLDFVTNGLGIGYLNKKYITDLIKNGELFELKTDFKIPPREIVVAINKKKLSNKTLIAFISMFH